MTNRDSSALPLVEELSPAPDAEDVFRRFARREHCLFLDSAQRHAELGRYSFVMADPFATLRVPTNDPDPLATMAARHAAWQAPGIAGLPPFQGGAAGLLGYDLGRSLERVPLPRFDEFDVPALAIGWYDAVVAFDHQANRAWIVSQGFPETDPRRRADRAHARLAETLTLIQTSLDETEPTTRLRTIVDIGRDALSPQFPTHVDGLTSNFTAERFQAVVRQAIEYIRAGDIFQVNLAQRLLHAANDDPVALYLRLRRRNPATFAGYFDLGDFQICSASPERFLRVIEGEVEARPIKGTRARNAQPEADLYAADDLQQSAKDRAENVMIVDLLRNDLSRVCEADSVQVTKLCGLESYAYVQHLVSVIRGRLSPGRSAMDLLRAAFPGGSITGAPKVRAMEIVAELEPNARGAYCGSLGYLGFDGTLDTSILIRTITAGRGWWQLPVGGGITAQSNPAAEYQETWHKAEGLLRALRP